MEKKETKKLTLYDGCILMVLFAVGALVLTPGVTQAVEGKKLSDMVDRLHLIRSQIMLYKTHNNGLLPGQRFAGDSVTSEEFAAALQQQRPDQKNSYLRDIPVNPYAIESGQANVVTCVNDANAMPTGREATGWWFNAATGDFFACDSEFHTKY